MGVSSPVVLDDYQEVMPDGALPSDLCSLIPAAENVDLPCQDNDFCGGGGICVQPPGTESTEGSGAAAPEGACSQVCFPEPPEDFEPPAEWDASFTGCGNSCPGSQTCATLTGEGGAPILLDLNLDGVPDVVGGACQSDATGDNGPFEACGSNGLCQAGNVCLGTDGRESGTCFPTCTETCDAFESYTARCSVTSADESVCLIACEVGNAASCPQGLECVLNARGNPVCVR